MSRRAAAFALLPALLAFPAVAQAPAAAPAGDAARLSPAEQKAKVQQAVQRMRELSAQVDKLSAQARSERDIVKLNCVNEKLAQVRGLLRVSEQADGELREALARRDDDGAAHATTKAQIAAGKVAQLRQDAEQCIGQLAYFNDEKTQVEVEVPKGLPETDPTYVAAPAALYNRAPPTSGL